MVLYRPRRHRILSNANELEINIITSTPSKAITPIFNSPGVIEVDWGDGQSELIAANTATEVSHTYAVASSYVVRLRGAWEQITVFNMSSDSVAGDWTHFPIHRLTAVTTFFIHLNSFTGDVSNWRLPQSLVNFSIQTNSLTGNLSGWILPPSLVLFYTHINNLTGDLSGWILPASLTTFWVYNNSFSGGVDFTGADVIADARMQSNGWNAAASDFTLNSIWAYRDSFTDATPALNIAGTNADPTGVYQAACPPTTPLEKGFELVNDSCAEGTFNLWGITY